MDQTKRIWFIKATLVTGLLSGLVISYPLWIGPRFFPYIPPSAGLATLPEMVEQGLFLGLLGTLVLSVALSSLTAPLFASLLFLMALASFDQMRWRPSLYHYALSLLAFLYYGANRKDELLQSLRLIVVCIYFWSGIHKWNYAFVTKIFPWTLGGFVPESILPYVTWLGIAAPAFEAAIGLALLFPGTRRRAVFFAIALHLLILLGIGPLGRNWNVVAWPWNIAMICLVWLLFWDDRESLPAQIVSGGSSIYHKFLVVVLGIAPALHLFALYDAYPSFSLYSGQVVEAQLSMNSSMRGRFPKTISELMERKEGDRWVLDVTKWSMAELDVPPYPERRIYEALLEKLCGERGPGDEIAIEIKLQPDRFTGERGQMVKSCSEP